jgi:CheY-like chemotaxis protein
MISSPTSPMAIKVLVFESDPAFAGELRSELGKLGCSITIVDDGNVGLQQAVTDRPDLVLLSIELPRMNGFSVCNKLKKDPNLKDVPLIIMSSESSDETFEQHKKLRTRAEDYVHKPIAFGELLQHIQALVPMGSRAGDVDATIVIDDEIEIGSTDYLIEDDGTQIGPRASSGLPSSVPPRGRETVDADIDAFADAAFGRLTGSDPPGALAVTAGAGALHNGSPDSAGMASTARRAVASLAPRAPSLRPLPGVDIAEHEKLREELVRTRGRASALESEVNEVRGEVEKWRLEAGEVERLTREVDELRAKLAAGPPKATGISSREFLDLREALNKKDKEILSLKEASSRKDKEHVESQDRMLALERAKSDLDEKSVSLEREAADMRDRIDALAADKDLAKKAADDFKGRLEKSRAENEGKDRQNSELRAKHGEETASYEAKLAALRSELDQVLANERAEHARALDESEERRKADVEQTRRDREASIVEAREQFERDRQEALAGQAAQIKQEYDGRAALTLRAHQQELDRVRDEAERAARAAQRAHESELAGARKQGSDEVDRVRSDAESAVVRVRAEAEQQAADARDALVAEHAEKVKGLENDRDARLAAIESRTSRELSEANDKLAKADMDLSAARGELAELREEKNAGDAAHEAALAGIQVRLIEVTGLRDELEKKHAAVGEHAGALEADLASARLDLSETKQKLVGESARASHAVTKWEADRQALERAKDAMAVALVQIEEVEGRSL